MINNLWSTPVLQTQMPDDLRGQLLNKIYMDYDLSNPPSDFNSTNILNDKSKEIQEFKNKVVYPAFNEFLQKTLKKQINDWNSHRLQGWLAPPMYDYSLNFHNHRGCQLSAVFYLVCDDDFKGGLISFTDPRMNSNRGYDESFEPWFEDLRINPKSGDIVVFPSFLYHFVSTYKSNIRLAIPVDLFLHKKQ